MCLKINTIEALLAKAMHACAFRIEYEWELITTQASSHG